MNPLNHEFNKTVLVLKVTIFSFIVFLFFPASLNAQQVTAIGSSASVAATNTIASFTVAAGSNRVLVVTASDAASTSMTGVTFNGSAMTKVLERTDGFAVDAIYTLVLGTSASTTSGAIVITSTNVVNTNKFISAMAFKNVNQATPLPAAGLMAANNVTVPSSSTLAVTSATGDLVIDIFDTWKSATPGSAHTAGGGQTVIRTATAIPFSTGGFGWWTTSTKPGAASVNMSRSTTDHTALIHLAANIKWDGVTLPVTLLSFNGTIQNKNIQMNWQTAGGINFKQFEIERSSDGITFEKIGTVAEAGNNSIDKNYGFTDVQPNAGLNYYRLKQTDMDGRFEYSKIITIKNIENHWGFSIYPNPSAGQILLTGIFSKGATYSITNTLGQTVLRGKLIPGKPINISTLQRGIYYIFVDTVVAKLLKQ